MFFISKDGGGWDSKLIKVPRIPDAEAVACYQADGEPTTADCFYHSDEGDELRRIALEPEDYTT